MMDVFVEQIVQKRKGVKEWLIICGSMLAAAFLTFFFLFILPQFSAFVGGFSILLAAAAWYGAIWLSRSQSLEFEYVITNGDITVDKIIARSRRKRVVSFDAQYVERMGKYRPEDHAQKDYTKQLMVSDGVPGSEAWYMTFRHKSFGNTLMVFSPNERTLEAIKPFLPRQLAFEVFGKDAFHRP